MICYIGIDPGEKDGALATLGDRIIRDVGTDVTGEPIYSTVLHPAKVEIYDCPSTLQEMDDLLCKYVDTYGKENIRVAIEKGVTQVRFPTGERDKKGRMKTKVYQCPVLWGNYQAWCALLTAHRIKYTPVPARRWQTAICDGKRKLSTKDRAWEAANRLYPQLAPLLKGPRGAKKYGRSDAACILEWCKRNLK